MYASFVILSCLLGIVSEIFFSIHGSQIHTHKKKKYPIHSIGVLFLSEW